MSTLFCTGADGARMTLCPSLPVFRKNFQNPFSSPTCIFWYILILSAKATRLSRTRKVCVMRLFYIVRDIENPLQDNMLFPARGTLMLPTPTPHPKVDGQAKCSWWFGSVWRLHIQLYPRVHRQRCCWFVCKVVCNVRGKDNLRSPWKLPPRLLLRLTWVSKKRAQLRPVQAPNQRSQEVQRLHGGLQYDQEKQPKLPCTQALWDSRKSLARCPKPNVKICQHRWILLNTFEYFWIVQCRTNMGRILLPLWAPAPHQGSASVSGRPPSEDAGWNGMKRDEMIKTLCVAMCCHVLPLPSLERPQKNTENRWKQL